MPTALAIHAHPDDEAFANAGRLRQLADQGYTVVGVIATAGEASELPAAGSLDQARRRRIAKYERALTALGARTWVWLEPDAGWVDASEGPRVAGAAPERLQRAVLRLIDEYSPDTILTVGADGLTGHPDHVAVARAVVAATGERPVPEGVWGARLRRDDVRAGMRLASSHADRRPAGSGRVTGTDAPLTVHDVRPFAATRRAALDIYRDGLGTAPLAALFSAAERVGDSFLLRAIYDAEGWRAERYERFTPCGAGVSRTSSSEPTCLGGCGQVASMDESDGQLLAATARGDADAFGRFYRRHEQQILRYAIAHCANASDVADVVGETFLGALRAARRFSDDGGDAVPWLFGIARRVLAHQRRSFTRGQRLLRRLHEEPLLTTDEAAAIDAAIDASRLAPQLAAALRTLRAKDHELVLLVSHDGLSPAQAGAVLGMNPNTARVRLSRARARLRDALADRGSGPGVRPDSADSPTSPHPEVPHAQP